MRSSIERWIAEKSLPNVLRPVSLDVRDQEWPIERADAIVCINMVHISPWEATLALMRGAGRVLSSGGLLFLYGSYRRSGRRTAQSNEAFDAQLRQRNSAWGVRDLEAVADAAAANILSLQEVVEMPANNLSVVFRKT
jgi:hypothetical protein